MYDDGWNDVQLFDEHGNWHFYSNDLQSPWKPENFFHHKQKTCIRGFELSKNFKEVPVWD